MSQSARARIDRFIASLDPQTLTASLYGIERECLRIDRDGNLALTPHANALGSALTHPYITTDFSEALLEFVTPPSDSPWEVIHFLCDLHKYTHDSIGAEMLWPLSMPCTVQRGNDIPLAQYGSSNVGKMKTVYRRGLGYRYGRTMQTIAGVHFNFSVGDEFWAALKDRCGDKASFASFKSAAYFGLLRNFRRLSWLTLYLFGASPAVCKTFIGDKKHGLDEFDDETLFLPYATSLRMSDLGYSSAAQSTLNISLNSLEEYTAGLARAIRTPYPEYEKIGVVADGEWRQLSAGILQIANEYYSVVRPKRVTRSGEKPTVALRDRGVEYVEIRALDISPSDPVGVNQMQLRFLECLLVLCAVRDSEVIGAVEQVHVDANQATVAARGREPGLRLARPSGEISLEAWSLEIFEDMAGIAESLDHASGGYDHRLALTHFAATVREPEATPSAALLRDMRERGLSHASYGCELADRHRDYFRALESPCTEKAAALKSAAEASIANQAQVEAADKVDFATYLQGYFAQV